MLLQFANVYIGVKNPSALSNISNRELRNLNLFHVIKI